MRFGAVPASAARGTLAGMATTVTLTSLPAGTTVWVVARTHANEVLADCAPDPSRPATIVARGPAELGPTLAKVMADESGRVVVTGLERDHSAAGLPTRRYFAVGQLEDGSWRRVSFSVSGHGSGA